MKAISAERKAVPDKDGFYSLKDRKPTEYDLCLLVGKNGKTCKGWMTPGGDFDGLRIERIDEVIAWKKS